MSTLLLSKVDPTAIHPARLAGPHAWARWGLAPWPDPWDDVTLLVPHRATHAADAVAATIRDQLRRPAWPPTPSVTVAGTGQTVRLTSGTNTATLTVTSHPWYGTEQRPLWCSMVVDNSGWPLIDEVAALRERLEALAASEVCREDIEHLAAWVDAKTSEDRTRRSASPTLSQLLHRLRRDAPDAYRALLKVERHAQSLPVAAHLTGTYRLLTDTRRREEHRRTTPRHP